jgi:signal transduction histidine kinase
LVVARSIAEQHGGSLTLEPGEGGGTVATLALPLEAQASEEDL